MRPASGFLCENSKFANLLDHNKITFGDKMIAKEAKVNTVPGLVGEVGRRIISSGCPVRIKACWWEA